MRVVAHLEPGRPARPGQLILQRRRRLAGAFFGGGAPMERLMDLGCGNGAQTLLLRDLSREVVGVDVVSIKEAEAGGEPDGFQFVQASAMDLPFAGGSFDGVVAFEVLEHVPDDGAVLREVHRVLKPRGRLLFTVPNKWWWFETHGAEVPGLGFVPWNRVPFWGWLPGAIHDRWARARNYTRRQAVRLADEAGFRVIGSGYVTAPLDVLPEGWVRRTLRATLFGAETTRVPFLAVNLFVAAVKELPVVRPDIGERP